MAQLHKGPRTTVMPRLPAGIRGWAQNEASRVGVSLSAYIADVMAVAVGRRDLVREVAIAELPAVSLVIPRAHYQLCDGTIDPTVARLSTAVASIIRRHGARNMLGTMRPTPMTTYVVCTLAAAMEAPLHRDIDEFAYLRPDPAGEPVQEALLAV